MPNLIHRIMECYLLHNLDLLMNSLLLPLMASITFAESVIASLPKVFINNCYDGDTCTTSKGETIRLACIDTPELKGEHAKPIQAKSAKNFLNDLVAYQEVSIKRITKDRYGRTVAELFKDEENIQELIVKKGFGKLYKRYAYQCDWSKEFDEGSYGNSDD